MEQGLIEKHINTWEQTLGEERFFAALAAIDSAIVQVGAITDEEALIARMHGEALGFAAHIETKESFFSAMNDEFELAALPDQSIQKVQDILHRMITLIELIETSDERETTLQPKNAFLQELQKPSQKAVFREPDFAHELELPPPPAPPENLPIAEPVATLQHVDPLAELKERMVSPKAIAPKASDYSMMPEREENPLPTQKPSIDPYRELPL